MKSIKNTASPKRLLIIYCIMMCAAIVAIFRIAYLQIFYKPDESYGVKDKSEILEPTRGDILACDGRPIAVSSPRYDIHLDCKVAGDEQFEAGVDGLAESLAGLFKDKSKERYKSDLIKARREGKRYYSIGNRDISHDEMNLLKGFPIFNLGRGKGGVIIEKHDSRIYPYGKLARRTVGYVKDNAYSEGNNLIGLEGKFNYLLHGKEGSRYLRRTENNEWIPDLDREIVLPEDGEDIRTTIDIELQDIADKALRTKIDTVSSIEGGCVIIMEVETGAIRAMVNLGRTKKGELDEIYNYAISQTAEPGSVFKLAALVTLIEDGKADLRTTIKGNHGRWSYNGRVFTDEYIHNEEEVSLLWGFMKSSNQVFRQLVCDNYTGDEKEYVDKLYSYKLCEKFNFDIEGEGRAFIPVPGSANWSGSSLPSIAIGYNLNITPLHLVTFYNAIANDGKVMKPYLVEAIEQNGRVTKKLGPTVLNGKICSQKTIDSVKFALRTVVEKGTGSALRNAKCHVSGKTGTARQLVEYTDSRGKKVSKYIDPQGYKRHQATFVGFFPSEKPKYTAVVVVYSKKTRGNFYGGSWAAPVFREIVDKICTSSPEWGNVLQASASLPEAEERDIEIGKFDDYTIPDITGMGLSDALYLLENRGFKVTFDGEGIVVGQSPEAGSEGHEGQTVKLELGLSKGEQDEI